MKVPFFGLDREYKDHESNISQIVSEVLVSGRVLQGPQVTQFEDSVAKYVGRKYAIAVSSATDALYFSFLANGIGPDSDVLVTDLSFVASASSILRAGANPIFVDVGDDYNMDLEDAKTKLTSNTKALLSVNLYGLMPDYQLIDAFCNEHNLLLIEDAAQSFGAKYKSKYSGSFGHCSCFSFDPTKVLSAPGSGGMVLTDDEILYDKIRMYRYHGKSKDNNFEILGFNSQMPTLTAAILSYKLKYVSDWRSKRRNIAKAYNKAFSDLNVLLPSDKIDSKHIYHKYVLRVEDRDNLVSYLEKNGVKVMIHYMTTLSRNAIFAKEIDKSAFYNSKANEVTKECLSLPIYPYLLDNEVNYITNLVVNFLS